VVVPARNTPKHISTCVRLKAKLRPASLKGIASGWRGVAPHGWQLQSRPSLVNKGAQQVEHVLFCAAVLQDGWVLLRKQAVASRGPDVSRGRWNAIIFACQTLRKVWPRRPACARGPPGEEMGDNALGETAKPCHATCGRPKRLSNGGKVTRGTLTRSRYATRVNRLTSCSSGQDMGHRRLMPSCSNCPMAETAQVRSTSQAHPVTLEAFCVAAERCLVTLAASASSSMQIQLRINMYLRNRDVVAAYRRKNGRFRRGEVGAGQEGGRKRTRMHTSSTDKHANQICSFHILTHTDTHVRRQTAISNTPVRTNLPPPGRPRVQTNILMALRASWPSCASGMLLSSDFVRFFTPASRARHVLVRAAPSRLAKALYMQAHTHNTPATARAPAKKCRRKRSQS